MLLGLYDTRCAEVIGNTWESQNITIIIRNMLQILYELAIVIIIHLLKKTSLGSHLPSDENVNFLAWPSRTLMIGPQHPPFHSIHHTHPRLLRIPHTSVYFPYSAWAHAVPSTWNSHRIPRLSNSLPLPSVLTNCYLFWAPPALCLNLTSIQLPFKSDCVTFACTVYANLYVHHLLWRSLWRH